MTNGVKKALITVAVVLFVIAVIAIVLGITLGGTRVAVEQSRSKRASEGIKQSLTQFYASDSDDNGDSECLRESDECFETESYGGATQARYGSGAVVIEQSSRRILYSDGASNKLYPASTTKILTALVVLNALPVETPVTVPLAAVGVEGSSVYLREGETLTVGDLLYALMLRSGNDAATALALAVSPSIPAFAELMNQTAVEIGAVNSHFVNPHGLHDDDHYTTAYDLALITAAAFENFDFRRIVSAKSAVIGEGESLRRIANKNKMLSSYDGANGVKTGFTKKSGRCLVSAAYKNGMQLISVVLNHGDMWRDSAAMLDGAFERYQMTPIEFAVTVPDGETPELIEIELGFSSDGDMHPKYYPLKKDGTERILPVSAA